MADFSVTYRDGRVAEYSGDDAGYDIDDHTAVLTVFDGEGNRLRFSPSGWLSVQEIHTETRFVTHEMTK